MHSPQAPTPPTATPPLVKQRTLKLSSVFGHVTTDLAVWAPAFATTLPEYQGRAALTIREGGFQLSLRPTVAELRRLALAATATADEMEMAAQAREAAPC